MSCHSSELHILSNHDVVEFKTFFYFRILNADKNMDNLKLMAEALVAMKTLNSEKKVGSYIFFPTTFNKFEVVWVVVVTGNDSARQSAYITLPPNQPFSLREVDGTGKVVIASRSNLFFVFFLYNKIFLLNFSDLDLFSLWYMVCQYDGHLSVQVLLYAIDT